MEVSREIYEELQGLGERGFSWLATDKDGKSYAYQVQPREGRYEWHSRGGREKELKYKNITDWEDKPILIDDIKCEDEKMELVRKSLPFVAVRNTNVNPNHYKGNRECIDEMRLMFGEEQVKAFCRLNVFKYRFRADNKNGQEDLAKAEWYMNYLEGMENDKRL